MEKKCLPPRPGGTLNGYSASCCLTLSLTLFGASALAADEKSETREGPEPATQLAKASSSAAPVGAEGVPSEASPPKSSEAGSATSSGKRTEVRYGRKGLRITSGDGNYKAKINIRSQIRFSSPFASAPRREKDFSRTDENDLRFRRARFKMDGNVFRPWIKYKLEYDLVDTRWLDARVTIKKWEWLQFRFGQWKTEYGRERVDSSGKQEFADRSIVNRQFTVDRQKGFQVLGRVMKGTRGDSVYHAGVYAGNGRGFLRPSGAELDHSDGSPLYVARYQWNFLKEDPGFSQTDVEYHEKPAAAVAISTASNRSRFTRFSSGGGSALDGFEVGAPGQFAIRQFAADAALKYRGLAIQHEFHWKRIRDRFSQRITRMRGAYVQAGYFFHHLLPWVPKQLEVGGRYAFVDPNRVLRTDLVTETAFVANWFFYGHNNKLTFDTSRYSLEQTTGGDLSDTQVRLQWDVSF